ncbi:MAG TPA: PepSY-associated TM helix domain-containing protein, partial [Methylomirabilota bacterium]|nr:PepSY-associated TM helix domain-containing protein [Methylomirabilota bacterium]
RSPLHALRALHTELYLGGGGRVAVGALGLLLALQGATGLFLWWPFTRRPSRGFTIRRGRRWRVRSFDLHKVIGIASLAFHVPVALTGAWLALSAVPPARAGAVEVREADGSVGRLDRASGAVTHDSRRSGERVWGAATALHEGRFGGPVSRWLYVAGGLTPVALAISGLGIWLGRPCR